VNPSSPLTSIEIANAIYEYVDALGASLVIYAAPSLRYEYP
jgi:hypothetical protein